MEVFSEEEKKGATFLTCLDSLPSKSFEGSWVPCVCLCAGVSQSHQKWSWFIRTFGEYCEEVKRDREREEM